MAEADLRSERPALQKYTGGTRTRPFLSDLQIIEGALQAAGDFGKELPADKSGCPSGVFFSIQEIDTMDQCGEIFLP